MDVFLLTSSLSLFTALGIIFIFYEKIKRVWREYFKAKNLLNDIILSFNRDLKKNEEKIEVAIKDSESLYFKNLRGIEEINSKIFNITENMRDFSKIQEILSTRDKELEGIKDRLKELFSHQESLMQKIISLEALKDDLSITREASIETAIPIKRERAMALLTETELKILGILATEGEKTASQIRDKIKLTREHTSRLMKSLYARGYVERNTERIPFTYHIKKEMEDILEK